MSLPARPVLIAGATASGKSNLALQLAVRDNGWVINADALQVYSCWDILTARPDEDALRQAPHKLYGHVDGDTRYSVGQWLRDLDSVLAEAKRKGFRPIIVGGTGLYMSALTEGLSAIPRISQEVREKSRNLIQQGLMVDMIDELERVDPTTMANIDRNNPVRVQRAWEVWASTGRRLSDWHRDEKEPLLQGEDCVKLVLDVPTDLLRDRIATRFDAMIAAGAQDECARYLAMNFDPTAPSAQALGARQLIEFLRDQATLSEARDNAVIATRQYAKRQRTWFRKRMQDWSWCDPMDASLLADIPRH